MKSKLEESIRSYTIMCTITEYRKYTIIREFQNSASLDDVLSNFDSASFYSYKAQMDGVSIKDFVGNLIEGKCIQEVGSTDQEKKYELTNKGKCIFSRYEERVNNSSYADVNF